MKEVVLSKNLGYLQLNTAGITAAIGPTSYNMGTWEPIAPGITNVFVMKEEIDIAGLTAQELTFFPLAGDTQRGPLAMGNAYTTQGYINEWIYVCAAPMDPTIGPQGMTWNLVAQGTNNTQFQNVLWGQSWTWVANASLPSNFGIAVNTTLMGSGEPTNGDRLYVYRLISTAGYVPTPGSFADIPSVRLLISGQLKEEQEYQQLMRLRRTYELQQTYDED